MKFFISSVVFRVMEALDFPSLCSSILLSSSAILSGLLNHGSLEGLGFSVTESLTTSSISLLPRFTTTRSFSAKSKYFF